MENNIKNYNEENENLKLKLEWCNRILLLKQKEHELYRLKSNGCRKRKSKFPINFKPKILKPNEIKPIEVKNDPKIDQLYEMTSTEELLQSDIKNELITKENKMKREFNINKDDDLIIEPHKKPTIVFIDKTPKGYIKQYKLDIISEYIENQIIKNRDIIKETLLEHLKNLKGLN